MSRGAKDIGDVLTAAEEGAPSPCFAGASGPDAEPASAIRAARAWAKPSTPAASDPAGNSPTGTWTPTWACAEAACMGA